MPEAAIPWKLVLDTNTVIRGLANEGSPSDRVLSLCLEKKLSFLLSKPVVAEYRRVLAYPELKAAHPELTAASVELLLRRLRYFSEFIPKKGTRFRFDRDPDDEKFLELAIAGHATHVITHDLDLLSLPSSHSDAARRLRQRLPNLKIMKAVQFMRSWDAFKN